MMTYCISMFCYNLRRTNLSVSIAYVNSGSLPSVHAVMFIIFKVEYVKSRYPPANKIFSYCYINLDCVLVHCDLGLFCLASPANNFRKNRTLKRPPYTCRLSSSLFKVTIYRLPVFNICSKAAHVPPFLFSFYPLPFLEI
jgi:hypothetical protein